MKKVEKHCQVNFFPAVVRSNCPHRSWRGKTRGYQACWKVLRRKYLLSQPALHRGKSYCASWDSAGKENENLIQNILILFVGTFKILNCNKSELLMEQCRLCIFTIFKGNSIFDENNAVILTRSISKVGIQLKTTGLSILNAPRVVFLPKKKNE